MAPNVSILRGHLCNSRSAGTVEEIRGDEGVAADGALCRPARVAGVRPGILAGREEVAILPLADRRVGAQAEIGGVRG